MRIEGEQPMLRWIGRRRRRVTMGVQAIVTDGEGRVLLVRHSYREGWHFPGGGVEIGETVETSLARELVEEAGVLMSGPPALLGIYSHFDVFPGDHIAVYRIEAWTQPSVPPPNREIAEQRFFAIGALPRDIAPGTRRRIAEVFEGAAVSEAW
jgi:ADP-ribose pyrophosphatase YjhB (NUDIX family)